jgi:hypothetical protein
MLGLFIYFKKAPWCCPKGIKKKEMGQSKSKLKCMYLPAQSGKTRKIEEEIKKNKLFSSFCETSNDINFFISANVRLLVCQTASRLNNDLVDTELSDDELDINDKTSNKNVFTWISGNNCNTPIDKLAMSILHGEIDMVIMCAHSVRIKYLSELIHLLNKKPKLLDNKKINIWIDEADASINKWSKYEEIIEKEIIQTVTLVSATFDSIIKQYNTLPVMGFPETHPKCYRCLKDSIQNVVDYAGSAVTYVDYVLNNNEYLCSPGMRAFIPGDFKKETHYEIRNMLYRKYNFCILLINGDEKTLFTRDSDIDLSDFFSISGDIPEEFNTILANLYVTHGLANNPFAITGMECIKRGVTFQCEAQKGNSGFLFDYGIIPNISKKDEVYQSMARLFGNVGDFRNYKPVEIFSTTSNFKKVKKCEEIAVNLARIVYESNIDEVDKTVIKEASNVNEDSDWDLIQDEFNNRDEANNFLVKHGCNRNNKETTNNLGFLLSSVTKEKQILYYDDVIKELRCFKKTSTFDTKDCVKGAKYSRMYICYKNLCDPNSVVFIVRIIKKIR